MSDSRAIDQWYDSVLGQAVYHAVKEELEAIFENIFGFHALQLGLCAHRDLLSHCKIRHQIFLDDKAHSNQASLITDFENLPLACASIDLAVLPHTLSLVQHPESLLNEVDRILLPEGYILIIGVNPWSLWGLAKPLLALTRQYWGNLPFYSPHRVRKFLSQKGYALEYFSTIFHRPPVNHPQTLENLRVLDTFGKLSWSYPGGIYVLLARKQVSTLTRIKPLFAFKGFVLGKQIVQTVG